MLYVGDLLNITNQLLHKKCQNRQDTVELCSKHYSALCKTSEK